MGKLLKVGWKTSLRSKMHNKRMLSQRKRLRRWDGLRVASAAPNAGVPGVCVAGNRGRGADFVKRLAPLALACMRLLRSKLRFTGYRRDWAL